MVKASDIISFLKQSGMVFHFTGDAEITINTMSNLQELEDYSICWIKNKKFATEAVIAELKRHTDVLLVCPFEVEGVSVIVTDYPKGVFFSILNKFFSNDFEHSISGTAKVSSKKIGRNVHIGYNSYIGDNVEIGDGTIIFHNVVVDCPCVIGSGCIIHSGVVIGTDVEGFYFENDIPIKETHFKGVAIGDNVEIGANTTIARGLLTDTVIGNNVKIWDLCHIGHNANIGDNTLVIVGSYVCGSAKIGKNSYLAPASTVLNQVTIGERVTVGVNSVAMGNIASNATIMGTPGIEFLPKAFRKGKK